ncbi:MAG: hypothetical protein AB7O21_10340 [Gammaproteobacteria bacterium]
MARATEIPAARPQRGLATLLVLLVLTSVGAYFLLRALNAARGPDAAATGRTLQAARDALLGYAVRYPDNPGVPLDTGPGRLPCPDLRVDPGEPLGAADSPCALSSGTETGRLPWHTLDLPALTDASGAPPWYAVADPYRSHLAGVLNTDTAGTLDVAPCTGSDDVVALIIAPGAGLGTQARGPAVFDPAAYLEGDNATRGDGCFTAERSATANDTVRAITRRELMGAVEARVLAEVADALRRYHAAHGAYPWLAPFAPPATATFRGEVGRRRGLLPLRQSDPGPDGDPLTPDGDPADIAGSAFAFAAPFVLRWASGTAGSVTTTGAQPPLEACVRASADPACTSGTALPAVLSLAGDVSGVPGGEWAAGLCKVTSGGHMGCHAVREVGTSPRLRRTYTAVLTGWPYRIDAPDATTPRRQRFARNAETLPVAERLELELSDTRIEPDGTLLALGSSRLVLAGGDLVDAFELAEVPFDLEVDDDGVRDPTDPAVDPTPDTLPATRRSPGELPRWLRANEWHHRVFVAYAQAYAPGDTGGDCATHALGCLTVNTARGTAPAQPVATRALVLGAGRALGGAVPQTRPGTTPADYYEDANAVDDDVFEQRDQGAAFDDRVRALDPLE